MRMRVRRRVSLSSVMMVRMGVRKMLWMERKSVKREVGNSEDRNENESCNSKAVNDGCDVTDAEPGCS